MNLVKQNQYLEQLITEYQGLNNFEAYLHSFGQRLMKPINACEGSYWGCDQRLYMAPYLEKLVGTIANEKAQILDVGGGAGDVVHFALHKANNARVHVVEPNPALLETYAASLKQYANLEMGIELQGTAQDFYEHCEIQSEQVDLALAIHMIYHLSDFTQKDVKPQRDINQFVAFIYDKLKVGGSLFLVYCDQHRYDNNMALCGMSVDYYHQEDNTKQYAENIQLINESRNSILGEAGSIESYLNESFPSNKAKLTAHKSPSHFFGENIADVAALSILSELCLANAEPFDTDIIRFAYDFILENPSLVGLCQEEANIPQQSWWRVDEPQIITVIQKTA